MGSTAFNATIIFVCVCLLFGFFKLRSVSKKLEAQRRESSQRQEMMVAQAAAWAAKQKRASVSA